MLSMKLRSSKCQYPSRSQQSINQSINRIEYSPVRQVYEFARKQTGCRLHERPTPGPSQPRDPIACSQKRSGIIFIVTYSIPSLLPLTTTTAATTTTTTSPPPPPPPPHHHHHHRSHPHPSSIPPTPLHPPCGCPFRERTPSYPCEGIAQHHHIHLHQQHKHLHHNNTARTVHAQRANPSHTTTTPPITTSRSDPRATESRYGNSAPAPVPETSTTSQKKSKIN